MLKADILVVGGSAAGVTAAITARRQYPEKKITLVRKEEKSLIPCGIPYIFGTIGSPEKDIIQDAVLSQNNIDLIIDEVVSIDKNSSVITTAAGQTIAYKKMILAIGSLAFVPPLSGVELDNVFTVKKDMDYLRKFARVLSKTQDIVIIGGGFIGLEFADECKKRGIANISLVELLPHCLLLACDEEICIRVEKKLAERGIKVMTNTKAKAILGDGKVKFVELGDGRKIKADVVILAIGVVPNIKLAEEAGLKTDKRQGILVDELMCTSDKNILAVGDCASKKNWFTGIPSNLRLASIATTEARVAGANLFSIKRRNRGSLGIFSTVIGDLAIGAAGLTERQARENGFEIVIGEAVAPDKHPGCMPGSKKLGVKLVFKKDTGLLIGGQVYGGISSGEIINFIGSMIQHRMRVDEIATFQIGTHPMVTASPVAYQITNAAEIALKKM